MLTNKFLIGRLIRVHVSSIVNEAIKTISRQFIFFTKKVLNVQKHIRDQNQPIRQKQASKKQQRHRFFAHKNF